MAGGRPLYKLGKSMRSKTIEEMDLPKQAFAMIPMSDVFDFGDLINNRSLRWLEIST